MDEKSMKNPIKIGFSGLILDKKVLSEGQFNYLFRGREHRKN